MNARYCFPPLGAYDTMIRESLSIAGPWSLLTLLV